MEEPDHLACNHVLIQFYPSANNITNGQILKGKIPQKHYGKAIRLHRDVKDTPLKPTWCTYQVLPPYVIVTPVEDSP